MSFRRVSPSPVHWSSQPPLQFPHTRKTRNQLPNQQQRKLSNDERREYIALNELVDAVTAGKQPAPADLKLKFQNHFLKSSKNVYIPYIARDQRRNVQFVPGHDVCARGAQSRRGRRAGRRAKAGRGRRPSRARTGRLPMSYFLTEKNLTTAGDVIRARTRAGAAAGRVHALHRDARAAAERSQAAAQDGRAGAAADGARYEHGADDEQRHPGEGAGSRPGAADGPAAARAAVHHFRLPGGPVVRRAHSAVRRAHVRVFHLQ